LTEQALADYADTLAHLGAAIRLYRDTFRRLGLLGGQGRREGQGGLDGDWLQPTGKAGERFKQDFQPQDAASNTVGSPAGTSMHPQVA
jgi:hypothetical protein